MMGYLNSFLALGGGNLNKIFPKIQMPGGLPGGGGMLKLQFDWYIKECSLIQEVAFMDLLHSWEQSYFPGFSVTGCL